MSDNYTAYLPACFLQLPKLTRHEWMPGLVPCTLPLKLHEVPLGVLPAQRRGDLICLYPDLGSRGQEVGSGALGEEAVLGGDSDTGSWGGSAPACPLSGHLQSLGREVMFHIRAEQTQLDSRV